MDFTQLGCVIRKQLGFWCSEKQQRRQSDSDINRVSPILFSSGRRTLYRIFGRGFATAMVAAGCFGSAVSLADLVVISHKSVETAAIKKRTLRNIFTLNMPQWPDGTVTKVVVLDHTSRQHQDFTRLFLNIMSFQLQRHWERVIFSGKASPPVVVEDYPAMVQYVASTPGAIGYINTAKLPDGVKKIAIRD